MATEDGTARPGSHPKDVQWYLQTLESIDPHTRNILETYSKIPAEEVEPHVYSIRDKGWDIFAYPCIGQFRFLDLSLGKAPQYPEVLRRVEEGQRLLDTGCCFGQDIRRLVVDGAPGQGENLYGMDLKEEFFELGYELFRDRETLQAHFLTADIFAEDSKLRDLDGSVDIIHASSFFHLFSWDKQVQVAKTMVKILRPVKGSMILGRHVGAPEAGERDARITGQTMWRHNEESWRKMWDLVSEQTGTKWKVDFIWDEKENWARAAKGMMTSEGAVPTRYAVWRE